MFIIYVIDSSTNNKIRKNGVDIFTKMKNTNLQISFQKFLIFHT